MKTLAKVFISFSPKLKISILAIIGILAVLIYNTTALSVVQATSQRGMQKKMEYIQSLSSEWNKIDEIYLQNEKQIEQLKKKNAEIKSKQWELEKQAKEKRIEFVQEYGCGIMTGRCDYLKVEVPQKIEFRTNSEWKAKALPNVEPTLEAFAREYGQDPQDFIDAGKKYNIKPEVILCIARADSDLWRAMKSKNNIGNVGNNDRWDTREFDTIRDGIFEIGKALNNWYLGNKKWIQDLSRYWNCEKDCQYIYASSEENWENNVMNCLNFLYWNI